MRPRNQNNIESEIPEIDISRPLILLYLPQEWREYHRRPHWTAIARLTTVLAVEPPAGLFTSLLHPRRLISYLRLGRKVRKSEDGVLLVRPISLGSFGLGFRCRWLALLDRRVMRKQLTAAVASVGKHPVVTCVTAVQQYYVADMVTADVVCYELVDECRVDTSQDRVEPNSPLARRVIRREEQLLSIVDLVIASSRVLQESRAQLNPNTVYLPNCADYEHFAKAVDANIAVPADLSRIPHPRLGYIGGVNNLIDMDLLLSVATARPDCSIVLVGEERGTRPFRSGEVYRRMKQQPNVYFLGHRPYETLPAYLRGLDVCLMPFKLNAWMQASSPNKTYQYLASGKPVISTNFPEARELSNVMFVAPNNARFVELIDTALQATGPAEIAARQAVARANSTEARAARVMKHVTEALRLKFERGRATS